jgi:predicted heme/steroid binding protein
LGVEVRESDVMLHTVAGGQGDLDGVAYIGAEGRVFDASDASTHADEGHLAVDHGGLQAVFHNLACSFDT